MNTTRRKWFGVAGLAGGSLAIAGRKAEPRGDVTDILAVFAKRQSVRRYKRDPVPDAHLRLILDAARRTPTCMNQQPWKFLVVKDRNKIDRLRQRSMEVRLPPIKDGLARMANLSPADREARLDYYVKQIDGYCTAPVYVVVLTDSECAYPACTMHEGPMAAGYLMLAARALGYGTVYITDGIPPQVTREVLGIPQRYQLVCITPIGVPDAWPEPKPKKNLEELVAYESL